MSTTRESFAKRCFFSKSPFRFVHREFDNVRDDITHTNSALSPRALALFLLLFTVTWLNASQTYILSYRTQVKNAVVISESYQFSKAMTQIKAVQAESLSLYSPDETNLNAIMHVYKDEILEFMMKYGTHTRSHENVHNSKSSSLLQLTLPPSYITVDFNDDYATITRLITD